jgi:hypothetical protein
MTKWNYDPQTKTITITANGLYALGPSESEQYFIKVEVGGQDGEKMQPSGLESNQSVGGPPPSLL